MSDWKSEYERRLRRVAGVTDDTLRVEVEVESEKYYGGYCETCAYTGISTFVRVRVDGKVKWQEEGDYAFGTLMSLLDEVPDED